MMKTLLPLALLSLVAYAAPVRADDPAPSPLPAPPPVAPSKPAAPVVTVPTFENKTCPIMGKPSSRALFTDTDLGRVYVCCMPCVPKIKQDPAKAVAAAYPVKRPAGNTVDPVTGEKIGEKPFLVTLQGYEVALAGEANAKQARADAQIVLTKALNPRVVDVGNGTDPITGKPVVDNLFVLVDDDLIRLSAVTSVDAVRADPEKARRTAKETAAKEAEARAKAAGPQAPNAK
jgi:hypothetical protein